MATLEKIRSKSVFLIIVIGVALLAFIIGDALTNSRNIFGDQTTVAKIGGAKIDYTEYQQKREELNQQLEEARRQNPQQYANFDTQILGQMAIDQLVQETLVSNAADKAGIKSSGNILRFYMIDNPQSQDVMDIVRTLNQSGFSVQTPQQAYEVIFNPKRNGLTDAQVEPYQRAWLAAEKKMGKMIEQQTYQRLLAGTVKANALDTKALYNDYVDTKSVDLAFRPFGQLDAKKYPVSEQEIKAAYDKDKAQFAVEEPTKEISFIAVTVAPSQADQQEASALAAKTVSALNKTPGALPKDIKKEGVQLGRHSVRASDIKDNALKEYLASAVVDSTKLLQNNIQGFTAIRLASRTSEIDSIQVNVVSTATDVMGKKVLAALNGGLAVDSISVRFSPDSVAAQLDQWLPLFTAEGKTNAIPEEQLDTLLKAGGKFITLQSGPQGAVMAQVVKQNAPVTVYTYDEYTYVLGPSTKTLGDARAKLEKYVADNNTAEKFAKGGEKAGYNVQKFTVTPSTPAVPRFMGMNQYYPDSRQVMRWVIIDAKEGDVSHLYESKNPTAPVLYAAAVNQAYDDYAPVTSPDVKEFLTAKIRASKAGDQMVKEYQGKTSTMQAAAQAMGVNVQNLTQFRFGRNPGVNDAEVTGKICGAKKTGKPVIVKGQDGVYVFQVQGAQKENIPYNDKMYEQQYYQFVNPDLLQMLKGDNKLKNNAYKFEAGE